MTSWWLSALLKALKVALWQCCDLSCSHYLGALATQPALLTLVTQLCTSVVYLWLNFFLQRWNFLQPRASLTVIKSWTDLLYEYNLTTKLLGSIHTLVYPLIVLFTCLHKYRWPSIFFFCTSVTCQFPPTSQLSTIIQELPARKGED